jgi:Ca2+-binding EF-hand superfamily protein
VDGSIVFIDPISFSVLKKIQLRYSDYEIPKAVRESIRHLRQIFEKIRENQGKDVLHIFADITDRDTQEVKIRDFVAKLLRLDPTLGEDELYKACRALDNDGSGSVSLDEFLEFFGTVEAETASGDMGEDELEDEMWPEWLIREGKLPHAQSLLAAMFGVLEHEHGITAEQAFGIYDIHDTGDCSTDEFSRVLKIFFGEAIPKQEDLEFVMRLTQKKGDQRIDYRDFCKFLSKRVVRTFKTQGGASIELQPSAEGVQTEQLSGALQRELQRPLKKEASLTYVLRKTAELSLDLRKLFVQFDKSELSVIPRSKFAGILLDLPLGLN